MMTNESLTNLLNNLPDFLDKETTANNYKLMKSVGDTLDDIKDEITNLKTSIQVSTAVDQNLNDIGELFKLYRISGESDTSFRTRILSFWLTSKGGGTHDSIFDSIISVTGLNTSSIEIVDVESCIIKITITPTIDEMDYNFNLLYNTVLMAKAAGIHVFYRDILSNDLFQETLTINEQFNVIDSSDDGYFKCELSLCEDTLVPFCDLYYSGFAMSDYSRSDGDDLAL